MFNINILFTQKKSLLFLFCFFQIVIEDEFEPLSEDEQEIIEEDWQLLCRSVADENDDLLADVLVNDPTVDWSAFAETLIDIIDIENWIKSRKEENKPEWRREIRDVDVNKLNHKQQYRYQKCVNNDFINKQHLSLTIGSAGTGKSMTIHAINQKLGDRCLLLAPTGVAAFGIGGSTMHSKIQLPINNKKAHELKGGSLQRLQDVLENVDLIIIDEIGMVGQYNFAWVDRRLRQATGKMSEPFGGLSMALFGDFAQLPPVCDSVLYKKGSKVPLKQDAEIIYKLFDDIVVFDKVMYICI